MFVKDLYVTCQASDNINHLSPDSSYVPAIKATGDGPTGVAVDMYGHTIITNIYGNSITIFDTLNEFSRLDIAVGNSPVGVAVDYEGNIWVACSGGNVTYPDGCVARIDSETREVTYFETYYKPFGIAVDANGTVYTTHPEQKSGDTTWYVSKLSKRLNYQYELIDNLDTEPTGIAIDYNGNLWVSCANSSGATGTLVKLTLSSEAQCIYGKLSYTVGASPYGVACDSNGYVWVTNKAASTVNQIKISDGTNTSFPCNATPYGISVDLDNNVWVCNKESNKVSMLSNSDYSIITQYDVGNYPIGFGDMTGMSVALIVNHYKYLLVDGSELKTLNSTNDALEVVASTTTPTIDNFINNGFIRLIDINNSIISTLTGPTFDVLMWTDVSGNSYKIKSFAIPNHKLILQQSDISISTVENFNDLQVNCSQNGTGAILKLIVSVDGGTTWKSYVEDSWQTVDISDISNVNTSGMSSDVFNSLSSTDWETLIGENTTLRFGYYLNLDSYSDNISVDDLTMDINIRGSWKPLDNNSTDAFYELKSLTNLKVTLQADGNYKINYNIMRNNGDVESNVEEWNQIDVVAPESTSSTVPYVVDLSIPYTSDFKRREPHVLKFVPGESNVVRTACDFLLDDNTKFTVLEDGEEVPGYLSKYIVWDGTMKFKTEYTFPMTDEGVLGEGRVFSIQIIRNEEGVPAEDEFVGVLDSSSGEVYKFKSIVNMSVI